MATRNYRLRLMEGKHHDKPPKYSRKGRQGGAQRTRMLTEIDIESRSVTYGLVEVAGTDILDEPRGLSAVEGSTKPEDVNKSEL